MRERLFHGKKISTGEWVEGYFHINPLYKSNIITHSESGIPYHVFSNTVGQYTGVKDKNKVKIFENDTIKNVTFYAGYAGCVEDCKVKFYRGNFFVENKAKDKSIILSLLRNIEVKDPK